MVKVSNVIHILLAVAIFSIIGITAVLAGGNYDGNAAKNYALNWAKNPNPAYRDFNPDGGDCTNFVSQSLMAGGWTEIGKYSYTSDDAWYYDWSSRGGYSYTWTSATKLYNFLGRHYTRASPLSVARSTPWPNYFKVGDIVQADWEKDGAWDHSMVVTGINGNDLLVSYHSPPTPDGNKKDRSLQEIINENPNARFIGWHIIGTY